MGPTSDNSAVLMLLQHTVYIYNLQALPLLGWWDELCATWILVLRREGRGKRGPNRPAMPPLPGSYRLMGRQGFGEGGGGGQRRMAPDKLTLTASEYRAA